MKTACNLQKLWCAVLGSNQLMRTVNHTYQGGRLMTCQQSEMPVPAASFAENVLGRRDKELPHGTGIHSTYSLGRVCRGS